VKNEEMLGYEEGGCSELQGGESRWTWSSMQNFFHPSSLFPPARSFGMLVILLLMVPTAFIVTLFKLRYKQEMNIGCNICILDM
jgi:hypothetical protein